MEIRTARSDELTQAGKLTLAAYSTLPDFVESDPDGYSEVLLDASARAVDADVVVAVEDGVMLGCVTYVGDASSAMSEWEDVEAAGFRMLAVAPEAMGRGVGRALAHYCVERARLEGKARVLLHSTPFMTAAHRLYASLGFERFPEIDFAVDPVELLGFRLML